MWSVNATNYRMLQFFVTKFHKMAIMAVAWSLVAKIVTHISYFKTTVIHTFENNKVSRELGWLD